MVERRTVNPQVTGSSPVGGAILEKAVSLDTAFLHWFKVKLFSTHVTQERKSEFRSLP
ncbi:conserved hypothetical protein [Vibrio diabolicus]|nr:conserved hypothetical protein [Vibrio diabolicus]